MCGEKTCTLSTGEGGRVVNGWREDLHPRARVSGDRWSL